MVSKEMGCHLCDNPVCLCVFFFREDLDGAFINFLDCYGERLFFLSALNEGLISVDELTRALCGGHDD